MAAVGLPPFPAAEWACHVASAAPLAGGPADTARAAKASFPKGSLAIRIRDELGEVWSDQRFQDLFGNRGRPGISPAQLMSVLVLAMVENLTDRQAADMARRAIDWKYACAMWRSVISLA